MLINILLFYFAFSSLQKSIERKAKLLIFFFEFQFIIYLFVYLISFMANCWDAFCRLQCRTWNALGEC